MSGPLVFLKCFFKPIPIHSSLSYSLSWTISSTTFLAANLPSILKESHSSHTNLPLFLLTFLLIGCFVSPAPPHPPPPNTKFFWFAKAMRSLSQVIMFTYLLHGHLSSFNRNVKMLKLLFYTQVKHHNGIKVSIVNGARLRDIVDRKFQL